MADSAEAKKVQGRSPPFPFIDLERALRRLKEFSEHSRGHPVRMVSALVAWGYNPKSSGGIQTVAALKAYGLIADSGSNDERRVQVSELGKRLGRNPPAHIRTQLLHEAALKPKLIGEYWKTWGVRRPPDEDCVWALTDDRGFTSEAAAKFLQVYDATVRYAELTGSGSLSGSEEDVEADSNGYSDEEEPMQSEPAVASVRPARPVAFAGGGDPPQVQRQSAEWTERLRDREGIEIVVEFSREPSQDAYAYLRDYIDFKLGTFRPAHRAPGPTSGPQDAVGQGRGSDEG